MEVMQAIKERRSIRKYKADAVSDEALDTILEAARWAPSWANSQCWRLVVVRDVQIKAKLAETMRSLTPGTENRAAAAMRNAAVAIVACAQKEVSGFRKAGEGQVTPATDKGDSWFMFDLALAMQNLTLAAHSLGLGTVHVGLFDPQKVAEILGVPENVAVVEIMPLGHPDEAPAPRPRKELSEFVFYDGYGRR